MLTTRPQRRSSILHKCCKILNVTKEAKKQHDSKVRAKSHNRIKTGNTVRRETGKVHLTEDTCTHHEKTKAPETFSNDFF
jgi:hypothetical protein